ncbi:MAG: type 1 glutamine amidotransferase, partial [Betaproteobacteria bacterium]
RHYRTEGPGYFAIYLERCGLPWCLIRIDAGDPVPADVSEFSGIALMGGPMSVNDSLPWIPAVLQLIRRAVESDVPVVGHCLGGQLMAKALGGTVVPNREKEIGWGEVEVAAVPEASSWFGAAVSRFTTFHWHGETFSVPPGAVALLSSALCDNQAFVLGKHLAMQCHVEMTAELIESWCESGAAEIAQSAGAGVQTCAEIGRDLDRRLARLHAIADRIYARWVEGLVRSV